MASLTTAERTAELLAAARMIADEADELDDVTAIDIENRLAPLTERIRRAHGRSQDGTGPTPQ